MLFNFETLSQLVGEELEFKDSVGTKINLLVDKVVKGPLNDEQWASFSVFYKGDDSFQLVQGHYYLEHPQLGSDYIFIVPKDTCYYETMVSYKREPEEQAA